MKYSDTVVDLYTPEVYQHYIAKPPLRGWRFCTDEGCVPRHGVHFESQTIILDSDYSIKIKGRYLSVWLFFFNITYFIAIIISPMIKYIILQI